MLTKTYMSLLLLFFAFTQTIAFSEEAKKEKGDAAHLCAGCQIIVNSCAKKADGIASISVIFPTKQSLTVYDNFPEKPPCKFEIGESMGDPWPPSASIAKRYRGNTWEVFLVESDGTYLIAVGTHKGKLIAKSYFLEAKEYFDVDEASQSYKLSSVDLKSSKVTLTKKKRLSGKSEEVIYTVDQLLDGAPIRSS